MADVKITFRVGNRRGVMSRDVYAQDAFTEAMGEEVTRKAAENVSVDVPRLQRVLDTRIRNSLKNAVNFAAMNMIGVKSNVNPQGRADPSKIVFNMGGDQEIGGQDASLPLINPSARVMRDLPQSMDLEWLALSRSTIMKKSQGPKGATRRRTGATASDSARKFFQHTGSLQKEIKALASTVANQTGTVKIYYSKRPTAKSVRPVLAENQRRVSVGQLQLRFLPNIPIRHLKGFLMEDPADVDPSMAFEKSLRLSNDALKKLQGVEGYQRPLLQPVFSYWLLTRIPRLVGTAISNSIRSR